MTTVCNVCDGTEFTVNAGFYYCDNCGERATVLQEVEDDVDGQFDNVQKKTHKIKQIAQSQNAELTSWETYNYIIYGFVQELIQLGCKDELAMTTLQLWAAYLHKNEVAFFGKNETSIPRFSFKFNQRDARLIYSLPIKKRRTSSKASSTSSGGNQTYRQSKIALRKKKQSLANAQYEEYLSSQRTDISSVGFNLSQRSSTGLSSEHSDSTIRIQYSKRARRKVRGKIPRKHVIEHQNDIGRQLKCHNFKDKEVLGRSFVFALLWLALNQIEDSTQISDLIRYAKESHIKLNNISSFLPPNVDFKQAVNHFQKSSSDSLSHTWLRTKALMITKVIGIRNLNQPNLAMLCERYCKDLCLPPEISDMIKRLLAFHPPEMKISGSSKLFRTVPNYEGRAMAFIIFVLKLFFGLDGKREHEISASAQLINNTLSESDSKQSQLFVWTEWMQYIDMRNVILSQCHYPTAMQIDPNSSMHTDMYIDFLKRTNEDSPYHEVYRKTEMDNIRMIFNQVMQLHEQHEGHKPKPSCHFAPSHTPFSNYMEQILCDRTIKSQIYIPEYMSVDHEKRDILPYLKPKTLIKAFQDMKFSLKVNEIGINPDLEFVIIKHENTKSTKNVKFEFDVTRAQWIDQMTKRDDARDRIQQQKREQDNEQIKQKVVEHLSKLRIKQATCDSERAAKRTDTTVIADHQPISESFSNNEERGKYPIDDEIVLNEPRRNLDKQPNILDYESSDDESIDLDPNTESIEFVISNFDYWIAMQNIYYITNASFGDSVTTLPKNFQWLLKQCALQIHMNIKDLYVELLAIENQYRYVLKPLFKMHNYIMHRTISSKKLSAQTMNAVKNLKRIW